MDIQLRQSEIEIAVRQYVATQGLVLTGKRLGIQFSATRDKDKGIVANLTIEDVNTTVIPGFTDRPADATLQLVGTGINSAADVSTVAGTAQAPAAGTIGAAIANVNATTAAADKASAPDTAGTTAVDTGDVAKTVPEEAAQAAEQPAEAAPAADTAAAPAAATTTSLFGA
jgi:hypothetical protein